MFETYRTKLVMVGRHGLTQPSVQVDNVAATRVATEHLLGLGHRRIAFVGGPTDSSTAQDRLLGHQQALRKAGVPDSGLDAVRVGDFDERSGYEATRSLLDGQATTAVLCANDRMALGSYAALADAGLSIPGDVSVVGFDDVPMASFVRPTLTTIAVPTYEMGQAAMRLLLEMFNGTADNQPLPARRRVACRR